MARERLAALFTAEHEAVARYVRRRASPDLVDDAVAETFLVACRKPSAIPADPLPWLLGIARRVLATQRRSAKRRVLLATRAATSLPSAVTGEDSELAVVTEALGKLSDSDREAITLIAWDGLTTAQAAVAMGTSHVAFRARVSRARKRLQRELDAAQSSQASARTTHLAVRKENAAS